MKRLFWALLGAGMIWRIVTVERAGWLHDRASDDPLLFAYALAALALALCVPLTLASAFADASFEARVLVVGLAAFDPLSVAALYGDRADVALGGSLCAATACAILAVRAPAGRARTIGHAGCVVASLLAGIVAMRVAPVAVDPVFLAWADFGPAWLARVYAIVHHSGYAVLPLAIGGICLPAVRRMAWLAVPAVLVALIVDRGSIARFSTLAVFAPILVALAAQSLIELRAGAQTAYDGRLRAFGLMAIVFAVNAPVLASDFVSRGPRFHFAADGFAAGTAGPLLSTAADALRRSGARPLPRGAELLARLQAPFCIVLPIVNGRLWRGDEEQLQAVEHATVPRRELRARRFDLYRFELREYARP